MRPQIGVPGTFLFDGVAASGGTPSLDTREPDRVAPGTSRPPGRESCSAGPTAAAAWRTIPKCSASPRCSRAATTTGTRSSTSSSRRPRHLRVAYAHDANQRRRRPHRAAGAALRRPSATDSASTTSAARATSCSSSGAAADQHQLPAARPSATAVTTTPAVTASNPAALLQHERMPEVRAPAARGFRSCPRTGTAAGVAAPLYINGADPSGVARSSKSAPTSRIGSSTLAELALFERDAERGHCDGDRRHRARPHGPRTRAATRSPSRSSRATTCPRRAPAARRRLPSSRPSPRPTSRRPGSRESENEAGRSSRHRPPQRGVPDALRRGPRRSAVACAGRPRGGALESAARDGRGRWRRGRGGGARDHQSAVRDLQHVVQRRLPSTATQAGYL